jgi:hypothetical protein
MPAVARLPLALFASLMLAACGSPPPETAADKASADAEKRELGRDTDATVLDDMIQTQDKARAVEGLTLGRKGDLDQALEEQAGDGSAPAQ